MSFASETVTRAEGHLKTTLEGTSRKQPHLATHAQSVAEADELSRELNPVPFSSNRRWGRGAALGRFRKDGGGCGKKCSAGGLGREAAARARGRPTSCAEWRPARSGSGRRGPGRRRSGMASRPRESSCARGHPYGVGAGTAQPRPALRRPWEGGGGTGDPRRLARAGRALGLGEVAGTSPGLHGGVARDTPLPTWWRMDLEMGGRWAPPEALVSLHC